MATTEQGPASEVLLFVEKDGPERFRIHSDQLEDIGAKLRGRARFSVFNSIVLPLIVTLATLIFTGLFQFISWWNSVSLQNATDVANRAAETAEKVTAAIDGRRYSTFVFISTLRDLVDAKLNSERPPDVLSGVPSTTGVGGERAINPVASLNLDRQLPLDLLETNLRKTRFEGYYDQLKRWNERIDQLLTDVNYSLDRPIFMQTTGEPAGRHEGIAIYYKKLKNVDCMQSMTVSLKELGLNPNSLKLRLAGLNNCFIQLNFLLARTKDGTNPDLSSDKEFDKKLHARLDHIHTMGSELRCYALHRVDYYIKRKEASIVSPASIWRWMTDGDKRDALAHFEETAKHCSPQNRPT